MLRIEQLATDAGAFELRGINISAAKGSYGVLLGPPGAGKTVLIETLCGLRRASGGRIVIDGEDLTGMDPRERRIGYVPQDYALFPSKRVMANITFGLRVRGVSRLQADREVQWIVELLQIGHILDRWPAGLSGGERQRVALARALASRPRLLLMDEPVSALDESLRERVCRDLRKMQRELEITTIHISHNVEEALAVSDWAAVLDRGRLQQVGSMRELMWRPRNEMVARFLRCENVIDAVASPRDGSGSLLAFAGHDLKTDACCSGPVRFAARPEAVQVKAAGTGGDGAISARLSSSTDRGVYWRLGFDAGVPLTAYVPWHHGLPPFEEGALFDLVIPPAAVHVLGEACDGVRA